MQATGTFFLRGAPVRVLVRTTDAGPGHGWEFPLGWTEPQGGKRTFTATWRGADADRFMNTHRALKAGDCLQMTLHRLRARSDELLASVLQCDLAPPRWPTSEATRCAAAEAAHP